MNKINTKALAIAILCLGLLACSKSESESTTPELSEDTAGSEAPVAEATETEAQEKDIVDTAVAAGSFNTLVQAVQAAELVDTLKGDGPFTVFAPTDDAFAALPEGTLEDLLKPENKEKLRAILTYHVVAGEVDAEKASSLSSATTVEGSDLKVSAEGGTVRIDEAQVVTADIKCSNGIIHVIDKVVLPKSS